MVHSATQRVAAESAHLLLPPEAMELEILELQRKTCARKADWLARSSSRKLITGWYCRWHPNDSREFPFLALSIDNSGLCAGRDFAITVIGRYRGRRAGSNGTFGRNSGS